MILHPDFELYEKKGTPYCSSRQVAEDFGKRHDNVLQAISNAINDTKDFAPEFSGANFIESTYKDRGKTYPEILLTKDGFSYLVMGFTGEKAAQFKIAYIERFNKMEDFIKTLYQAKMEHPEFTRAVMEAHEEPKHYHFSNEFDMINRIVLGYTAKEFRVLKQIPDGCLIRPYLSQWEINAVQRLQIADVGLLVAQHTFQERKEILTKLCARLQQKVLPE